MSKIVTVGMIKERLQSIAEEVDEVNVGLSVGMSGDTAKILSEVFRQLLLGMEYIEKHDSAQQPIQGGGRCLH
ncbi:MAG: hypothetical protein N3A57_06495 [Negativicutes bacterium]|nr:hypothetical protein [Negativicutes bacterium]